MAAVWGDPDAAGISRMLGSIRGAVTQLAGAGLAGISRPGVSPTCGFLPGCRGWCGRRDGTPAGILRVTPEGLRSWRDHFAQLWESKRFARVQDLCPAPTHPKRRTTQYGSRSQPVREVKKNRLHVNRPPLSRRFRFFTAAHGGVGGGGRTNICQGAVCGKFCGAAARGGHGGTRRGDANWESCELGGEVSGVGSRRAKAGDHVE